MIKFATKKNVGEKMNCEKKIELKKLLCWNKLVLKKPVFKKFFVEKSFGNFFNRPKLLILTIFYIMLIRNCCNIAN